MISSVSGGQHEIRKKRLTAWQGILEANSSFLTGSFLVTILSFGPAVLMETVICWVFCFAQYINPLTPHFLQKVRFLDILVIFWLDLGQITGGQITGVNGLTKQPKIQLFPNFWRLGLSLDRFNKLSQKDPSFEKLGHVINPLTPETFCKKCVFWTFWWFLGWISAKLPLIRSKMRLQHNSLPFLPPPARFSA